MNTSYQQLYALYHVHLATDTRVRFPAERFTGLSKSAAEALAEQLQSSGVLDASYPEGWKPQVHIDMGAIAREAAILHICDKNHTEFGTRSYYKNPVKSEAEYEEKLTKQAQAFYALWGPDYYQLIEQALLEPHMA